MEKLLKGVCQCLCGVRQTAVLAGPSLIRNPCTRKRDPLITGHSLTHTDMTLSGATQGPSQGPVPTHTHTQRHWGEGREKMSETPPFPTLTLSTSSCYPIYHRPAGHRKIERNKDRENKIICTLTLLNPGSSRAPELMDPAS